ncbi:MAG: hypothetical protein WBP45_07605 [Daejeonella sp.]
MTDKLIIAGDIDAGWATLKFDFNSETHFIVTSYVFDGLDNILTAVSLLKQGLHESEASLIYEPGEHIIHLAKEDADKIVIRLYTFENWAGRPLKDLIDESHIPFFTIETTLRRLILQIINLFEHFKESYGLNGYKDRWRHEFPQAKLDNLRRNN